MAVTSLSGCLYPKRGGQRPRGFMAASKRDFLCIGIFPPVCAVLESRANFPTVSEDLFPESGTASPSSPVSRAIRFPDVFAAFRQRVLAICLRITRDQKDAEDASQEAFLAIWRELSQVRAMAGLAGWIGQIAVRTSFKFKMRKARDAEIYDIMKVNGYGSEKVNVDYRLSFIEALSLLPATQRGVFRLFVIEGFSQTEVARILEVPEGTVASRLHHAKNGLMKALAR